MGWAELGLEEKIAAQSQADRDRAAIERIESYVIDPRVTLVDAAGIRHALRGEA